jgi:hypothetical protein
MNIVLQEDEHPPRRVEAPLRGKGGVAGVIGDACGADRDMGAQPERPDRDEARNQPLPLIGPIPRERPQGAAGADKPDREGPDGVDPAGIAGALLHNPGERHQHRERERDGR